MGAVLPAGTQLPYATKYERKSVYKQTVPEFLVLSLRTRVKIPVYTS